MIHFTKKASGLLKKKKNNLKKLIIWFSFAFAAARRISSPLASWQQRLRLRTQRLQVWQSKFTVARMEPGCKTTCLLTLVTQFIRTGIQTFLCLPSATLLLSSGTGRDSRRPGSSGWRPVWSAGNNRSQAGFVGLQPGRTPPVAGRRRHKMLNTGSRTGTSLCSVIKCLNLYYTFNSTVLLCI